MPDVQGWGVATNLIFNADHWNTYVTRVSSVHSSFIGGTFWRTGQRLRLFIVFCYLKTSNTNR